MNNKPIKKLTTSAMLTAVAVILGFFSFPIFGQVAFLEYDLCDVVILITSFSLGPVYGVCSSVVVALIQGFLLDKSGIFGFIMNIFSTVSFILPASLIYLKMKTKKGAVISLGVGSVAVIIVMTLFNYIITPVYMGLPDGAINAYIPFILLFNFVKAAANSVITFFLYKHIGKVIKKFS